jgi:hypothetical protein
MAVRVHRRVEGEERDRQAEPLNSARGADPLNPARGVLIACAIGACFWIGVLALVLL